MEKRSGFQGRRALEEEIVGESGTEKRMPASGRIRRRLSETHTTLTPDDMGPLR